jgi:GntR family transcriptional regulator
MQPGQYLYMKLREQITAMILDGRCGDGALLPSVRSFAADTDANPLTVAKAYQAFVESGIVRMKRGVGLFVADGGSEKLRLMEKTRFLEQQWPLIQQQIKRLGFDERELVDQALAQE